MHHPLSWLTEWDQRAVQPALRARVGVLLRGHLHDPDLNLVATPHHRLVELPAGCVYDGSSYPNSVQFVEVEPGGGGRAHVRTWRTDAWAWVPDRNGFPPHGTWEFPAR